jgi:hypothetical protein
MRILKTFNLRRLIIAHLPFQIRAASYHAEKTIVKREKSRTSATHEAVRSWILNVPAK